MKNAICSFLAIFMFLLSTTAQETIRVDFGKTIKTNIRRGAGSANICWLMDSDLKRPNDHKLMKEALNELGVGSLRFPYGHLADNYLWNTPPFDNEERGIVPKVAALSQAPGGWDWAVNGDGTFKSAMDFDEFMALCQELDIKPLVVVNVFSFKYAGGPSFEQLKQTAVEWVKYAKRQNYDVAYWQMGNEVDHHKDLLTKAEYIEVYHEIAEAMKAIDPEAKIGPGILSDVSYYNGIVSAYPDLIDFTSCHQYAWPYIKSCSTYQKWKEHKSDYVPNVIEMQEAVSRSQKPDTEIVITETGVTPADKGMGWVNTTYKALWYFEMLMNEIALPNVAYTYFWGTHSPWGSRTDDDRDLGVLFRVDDNSRKPIAEAVKLANDHLPATLVQTDQIKGYVRTFAGKSAYGDTYKVFLINRNDEDQRVSLKLINMPERVKELNRTQLKGDSPESRQVEVTVQDPVSISKEGTAVILPPLSITVLEK